MTGDAVRSLRMSLGLTTGELAQVLGVNPSTLYRWEARGAADAKVEPGAARLLEAARSAAAKAGAAELGEELRRALLLRGGLFAVFRLLRVALGESDSERPS